MKKILFFIFVCILCEIGFATTVNYNWFVDDVNYAQTTCETGDDLILPTPAPTKYGYHFVGWRETSIYGSWSQSGTPTPQNPIEPSFKQFGNTVLRAVGSGDNLVADSYNPETRTITRRIGVKVLDGTEGFVPYSWSATNATGFDSGISDMVVGGYVRGLCSHFSIIIDSPQSILDVCMRLGGYNNLVYFLWPAGSAPYSNSGEFKQWLADQYVAGTPVTIYYPLANPIEESLQ